MATKRRPRVTPTDPRHRLIAAALDLAAQQGWRRTGIADIAAAADVPLDEAYRHFRSKFAILVAFRRGIDETVLAGAAASSGDALRDRVFDVFMRRFEALKPHRPALKAILRDSIGHPAAARGVPGLLRSMSWMLAAAGVNATGCRGQIATRLAAALYLSMFPTFLRDESADLGTTMATLDRRLRQGETLLNAFAPIAAAARKSRT